MKFIRVHSSNSQALQFNFTTDYQGYNTVSTVRETDSPPLQPLVPLLLGKPLISPLVGIFFSAHGLGTKVMSHMTLINMTVLTYYAGIMVITYLRPQQPLMDT